MGKLATDISSAEGCRLEAYKDTLGYWTIGYGHKLSVGKDWSGLVWTQTQADTQLHYDIALRGVYPARALKDWQFLDTDARQNAVAELCFNMGVAHWSEFVETRRAIWDGRWEDVRTGLLNSEWAHQVQPEGLDRPGRATRIANYLATGAF